MDNFIDTTNEPDTTLIPMTPELRAQHAARRLERRKRSNGIIVVRVDRFLTIDRLRYLQIKAQRPGLDIRFVFANAGQQISKNSTTTYGMWCERHGFAYAHKSVPKAWLLEPKKVATK